MSFALYAYRMVTAFGVDPIKFINALRGIPHYLSNYIKLRREAAVRATDGFPIKAAYPCLSDRYEKSGTARGHYFHQDLLVARRIFQEAPERHVDIGSRVDGFVAHVAAFRAIEILDIRNLKSPDPNILFRQADMMIDVDPSLHGSTPSLSCLHALEHFGLGRYGDPLNYDGHLRGLLNMQRILSMGGTLYLSVPIGPQRIEFDAHRVFSVARLLEMLSGGFRLKSFSFVDDNGDLHRDVEVTSENAENSFNCQYGCGIFELQKIAEPAA